MMHSHNVQYIIMHYICRFLVTSEIVCQVLMQISKCVFNEYISIVIIINDSTLHSKKCWVVLTQFWVKYGQTRNVGLKM